MTDQPTSKLLIAEPPLQVLPSLAVRIGLNESIFVQELHYMLINPKLGKTADGRKWVHCTIQEWHKTFPFWSVNTIRGIIERLVEAKIVLEGNLNETLSRRKWYAIDYETLEKKTIKAERKRRADYPNFGYTMKQRKANPPVSPNFGRSNVQTLDNDSSKDSSKDSFKLSTDVDNLAAPEKESLTDTERHLLKNCQDGKVIEAYYNPVDVKRLIDLGLIERCKCGVREALCLKGQCNGAAPQSPTDGKGLPEQHIDPAIPVFQASLLPMINTFMCGIDPETTTTDEDAKPQSIHDKQVWADSPPPPAPALPEVPEGYEAWFSSHDRHYVKKDGKTSLCKMRISHWHLTRNEPRFIVDSGITQCPTCAARAAAPSAKAGRAHDVLFVKVAQLILHYPPENGRKYTKQECQFINGIKSAIMRTLALPEKPTEADYQRGADAIPKYQAWFPKAHPDLTMPTHAVKFQTYFNEWWEQQGKGAGLPAGDFDERPVDHGQRYVKRVHGVLLVRLRLMTEWNPALPSEVERWQSL